MRIEFMPLGALETNCYFLISNKNETIIIDPGSEPDKVISYIENNSLKPIVILCTHGHFDHIGAVKALKEKYNVKMIMHEYDEPLLAKASYSSNYYGLGPVESPEADAFIEDNSEMEYAGINIKVLHTPGHTKGSVCFYIESENKIITGDTLFKNNVGRTDLEGGSFKAIENSIKTKLYTLNPKTTAYPGHGESTDIEHEKKYNPYVRSI